MAEVSDKLNISKIETFFDSLLRGNVSEQIYFTELPKAILEEWSEVIVVDLPAMTDMNAYGSGTALVLIYVPPRADGSKNVPVFSAVEQRLNDVIATNNNGTYKIQRRETYADYDSQRDLFYNVYSIRLTILT